MSCLVVLLWAGTAVLPSLAQSVSGLQILAVDTSEFPAIAVSLLARDENGRPVTDLAGLALEEDGRPIAEYTVDSVRVGLDLVFVLDANETINNVDLAGGESRLAIATAAIQRFADRVMTPLDRLWVVVPDGEADGRFLVVPDDDIFQIRDALAGYERSEPAPTPLEAMLNLALDQIDGRDGDRLAAILLLTDGASLDRQLDFDALTARAAVGRVGLYAAILGARADPNEIDNVTRLSQPTGGAYLHLSAAADSESLYTSWTSQAQRQVVRYRSRAASDGAHQIAAALNGATATASFRVAVAPPVVRLIGDPAQPIRRVGSDAGSPPSAMEPATVPILASVEWLDGYRRNLAEASLWVDGVRQVGAPPPILSGDRLTLVWLIRDLDSGQYALQVRLTDELGLAAESETVRYEIVAERPLPPPTPAIEAPLTAATPLPAAPAPDFWTRETTSQGLAVLSAGLLALLLLLGLAAVWQRRRLARLPRPDLPLPAPPAPPVAPPAIGYLAVQANAPEHNGLIPLQSDSVRLGREAARVDIRFGDESVSPLHARIRHRAGAFHLVDEGSAAGTYLNFERIGLTPQPLADGDDIHLGRVHLRFFTKRRPGPAQGAGGGDDA